MQEARAFLFGVEAGDLLSEGNQTILIDEKVVGNNLGTAAVAIWGVFALEEYIGTVILSHVLRNGWIQEIMTTFAGFARLAKGSQIDLVIRIAGMIVHVCTKDYATAIKLVVVFLRI